jgi:hypothetical protein
MHFVVIFGPPAVGKMTVGMALCERTGFRLFHNHMTVEPILGIFPFGSPLFARLVNEFRARVIEAACEVSLPGLVFTFVWGVEREEDRQIVQEYVDIVESHGGTVSFVELTAALSERLRRDRTPLRLEHKRSKRADDSQQILLDLEGYVLNTSERVTAADQMLARHPFIRIDNTSRSPEDVADEVMSKLRLPRVGEG